MNSFKSIEKFKNKDSITKKLNYLYNFEQKMFIELFEKRNKLKGGKHSYNLDETENYINHIRKIIKSFLDFGEVRVTYKYSKNSHDHGRLYANTGLTKLQSDIRNYLIMDEFNDIDIVNACPSILKYIKDCHTNIKTPMLDSYVKNRKEILKKYNISKTDILSILFKEWEYKGDNKFLIIFHKEIIELQDKIYNHKDFKNITKYNLNANNKKGSFLSRVLFYYESMIISDAIRSLKQFNINTVSILFDGFFINKTHNIEKVLKIINKNKYNISFCCKIPESLVHDFVEKYNLSELEYKNDLDILKEDFEKKYFMTINPVKYFSEYNIIGEKSIVEHSMQAFEILTAPYIYNKPLKNGETSEKPFFREWVKMNNKRMYEKFDFYPNPELCPKHIYNIWTGFNAKYIDDSVDITDFLQLLQIMANNNNECYMYLLKYLADMIQYPENRPNVCVVLKGMKGTGKDLLGLFVRQIIGEDYHYCSSRLDTITGKFNGCCSKKLFVQMDELKGKDGFENDDDLKSLITCENKVLADKGVKQWIEKNYMRLFINTNNDNVLNITSDNRRFFVCKTGKKREPEFYKRCFKHLTNKKYINSIYSFLLDLDLTNFDVKDYPATKEIDEMKIMNTNPLYIFLHQLFVENIIEEYLNLNDDENKVFYQDKKKKENLIISCVDFSNLFKEWMMHEDYSIKYIHNYQFKKVCKMLTDLNISKIQKRLNGKNTKVYKFIFDDFRETLSHKYSGEIDVGEDDGVEYI